MNKFLFIFFIFWSFCIVTAQKEAVTPNGDTVILNRNNTWFYKNWQAPEMIYVIGGSFSMGSELDGVDEDEKPLHEVTLSSYHIGKYEVTVKQFRDFCQAVGRIMPEVPPWGWIDDYPMVNISWYDAVEYCEWLSLKTEKKYHLPTEAQWEFAAKGATRSKGYAYSGSKKIDEVAWFADNTNMEGPRRVGTKMSNELGIHDMSGNVAEWCQDFYEKAYYSRSQSVNPKGPNLGTHRIVRGGSWKEEAWRCRTSFRYINTEIIWYNFMGFRIAMDE